MCVCVCVFVFLCVGVSMCVVKTEKMIIVTIPYQFQQA
jgi:hypothetical protein